MFSEQSDAAELAFATLAPPEPSLARRNSASYVPVAALPAEYMRGGGCFAPEATVEVEGKGATRLDAVAAGDRVRTADGGSGKKEHGAKHAASSNTTETALKKEHGAKHSASSNSSSDAAPKKEHKATAAAGGGGSSKADAKNKGDGSKADSATKPSTKGHHDHVAPTKSSSGGGSSSSSSCSRN